MSSDFPPDYDQVCRYFGELKARGVSLGLKQMERILQALGNPHMVVPCIHIAGTNGKGSVAAMLEATLRRAGWRTGLYTSPHLVRLGERVQVNRRLLAEKDWVNYVHELKEVIAGPDAAIPSGIDPSYFEFVTALAFLHFARTRCDISCIEVGLGGRLDATNLVVPEVSVITSIGLDHCEVLGHSLAAIASEKAGIIKPGRPLVIGRLPSEAEHVIREIAAERGAQVISVVEVFGDDLERYPATNLEGDHQRVNAATATLAARALPPRLRPSEALIATTLRTVDWPARWQRFSVGGRTVILDSSHNAEGAVTLDGALESLATEQGRRPIVVAGVLGLSRARPLIDVLSRRAREIHFVRPAQSRACSFEELESLVAPDSNVPVFRHAVADLFPSATFCRVGEVGDVVVVTGSLYLAGEVLARLDPTRGPYEGHLQDF